MLLNVLYSFLLEPASEGGQGPVRRLKKSKIMRKLVDRREGLKALNENAE